MPDDQRLRFLEVWDQRSPPGSGRCRGATEVADTCSTMGLVVRLYGFHGILPK